MLMPVLVLDLGGDTRATAEVVVDGDVGAAGAQPPRRGGREGETHQTTEGRRRRGFDVVLLAEEAVIGVDVVLRDGGTVLLLEMILQPAKENPETRWRPKLPSRKWTLSLLIFLIDGWKKKVYFVPLQNDGYRVALVD